MKKILVGLDGSPRERPILDAAVALARKTGAKVFLLRCIGMPNPHQAEESQREPGDLPHQLEAHARQELDAALATVPAELRAGARVVVGTPWEAIDREATAEDVDLIVIGSHGYDTLDRLIGTTAAKVVNHADRSVLVVRAPARLIG